MQEMTRRGFLVVERNSVQSGPGSVSVVHHSGLQTGINAIRDSGRSRSSFTGSRLSWTRLFRITAIKRLTAHTSFGLTNQFEVSHLRVCDITSAERREVAQEELFEAR